MNGSPRSFCDTNILAYLFDNDEPAKRDRARQLFDREGSSGRLVLSTQVLQELYVTLTRKLKEPVPPPEALGVVKHLTTFPVVQIDPELITEGILFSHAHKVSFWDALIVQAAIKSRCTTLFTEDLQDGREIGETKIVNPFLA